MQARAPILLSQVTEDTLRKLCDGAEHARLIRALGACSGIIVPLVAHGSTLGAISLARAREGQPFEDADLESVQAIADRAANAIACAQLYHQAKEAVRLRDEFFCVASHELNTPLAALMLNLESMRQLSSRAPRKLETLSRVVELTERQGQRLTRLIHDLLDATRIDQGLPPALLPGRVESA